jgi:hypothetical protein
MSDHRADLPPAPGPPDTGQRDVLEWHRAVAEGREPEPAWEFGDNLTDTVCLAEHIWHPEVPPLLALYQVSAQGEVLGEIWLRPADLAALATELQRRFDDYASGERRWLGYGPRLEMGLHGATPRARDYPQSPRC